MYPRFVEGRIHEALADTRVVLVHGPRQSGKTTLTQHIAGDAIPFISLDDATALDAAATDPVGFVRGIDRAVIDEVQRVPELILAIKTAVDTDSRPGRFLLTGSAHLMTLPRVADSLAGRMGIIRLLPLAQKELRRTTAIPSFLDRTFAGEIPTTTTPIVGDELMETVLSGGYPEALTRLGRRRRQDWYVDYVEAIVQRDVRDIAQIEKMNHMSKLLRVLAEFSGQLVNYSAFGAPLGMNHITTQKYLSIFEKLFLVHTLPPWHTNALKRLTKSSKLHFLDTGLLGALRGITPDRLRHDRVPFGAVLETFVLGELLKLESWAEDRYTFSHFRDKERNEVDIVIENRLGQIVGVEVKASATVSRKDFSGLRRLASATRDKFVLGVVLYDSERCVPFEQQMVAAPVSTLWE